MLEDKIAYVHEHPEVYFTQEARKGGYICPVCENGIGTDGAINVSSAERVET